MRILTPLLTFVLSFILFSFSLSSQSLVFSEVSEETIEIFNQGTEEVDLTDYWLCNRPGYDRIGSLPISCGNLVLGAGELLTVTPNFTVNGSGDELGLYSTNVFDDPTALVDYVIWGERSGATRESVAVSAGIWTPEDRATFFSSVSFLAYDGDGNAASDYFESENETPCVDCPVEAGNLLANDTIVVFVCVDDTLSEPVVLDVRFDPVGESLILVSDSTGVITQVGRQ